MKSPAPGSLDACLRSLAADPSRAGFEFEKVATWWLTTDPVWSSRVKKAWPAKDWPGRSGNQDLGTDLVVELVDGGLMAVQVKHRGRVSTAEIDSFLADTVGRFEERMLLATTDDIAANGRKKLRQAGAHIVGRGDLEASPVVWPTGTDLATGRREPPRTPRAHQIAAATDAAEALEAGDRCRVVMACGSGKTLAAQVLAERIAPGGLVVVAVPSLSLLAQTLESWARDSTTGLDDWLAVCSDPTVADAPDTSEMPSVTTDPADVTAWLRRRHRRDRQRVVFVTHASLPVLADALATANRRADLLLVDEAHRVAGRGALAQLATGPEFPARWRVFLTATPRIYTAQAKSKADGEGVEVISMDDETRFGPEAHHLTFAQAVDLGLLVDFEIVVSIITDTGIARLVDQRVIGELAGVEADMGTLAAHVAVARALHEWDAKRTISFHTRIAQAADFAAHHAHLARVVVPDETVIAEATSGRVPAGARRAALGRLAHLSDGADRRLLANARVLSEGIDVPAVDAIAFIDPRRSVIDIAQAVGRAMRTAPDKTRGLVVVPVHLPAGNAPDTIATDAVWKPVWDTLRALRSIDERLAERLDQLRYQLGRRSAIGGIDRLHFLTVEPLDADFVDAVTTRAVRVTTRSWEEWFGLLEVFAERKGHAHPPPLHIEAGIRLGAWVNTQRQAYRRGHLSPERAQRLDELPGWLWFPDDTAWEHSFEALSAYVDREGHAEVRGRHAEGEVQLGKWVSKQRSIRNRGLLSGDRQARLDALPGWQWAHHEARVEKSLAALSSYVEREGHARVPSRHTEDGVRLGRWVEKQRRLYRRAALSPEQVARLEAVRGWTWTPDDDSWERGVAALERYAAREGGTLRVSRNQVEDGVRLSQWMLKQRQAYKGRDGRQLSAARAARLEAVPGWSWDPVADRWEEGFAALLAYVEREGHAQVPFDHHEGGIRLGKWVNKNRTAHRKGQLSMERANRLEMVVGWAWDVRDARWEEGFAALLAYAEREGDAQVPFGHCEGSLRLGGWVNTQRTAYRRRNLSEDRVGRLETVPGWVWDARHKA